MATQVATLARTPTPRTYVATLRMGPKDRGRGRGRPLVQWATVMEVRVERKGKEME